MNNFKKVGWSLGTVPGLNTNRMSYTHAYCYQYIAKCMGICLLKFVKSSNNKNILTTKKWNYI